jgi:hypothetical protein
MMLSLGEGVGVISSDDYKTSAINYDNTGYV